MKKILLLAVMFALVLCLVFTGCQNIADDVATDASDTAEGEIPAVNTDEDPQQAITNQQTLDYLSLLGLDEACSYQLGGTFPSGIENKDMYLVSVINITKEDFSAIENKLKENGFVIVSDINSDEERQTRIYPYSNNDSLYIEIVFSYGVEYFDVTFTPTS
jgi:hypothetical protein